MQWMLCQKLLFFSSCDDDCLCCVILSLCGMASTCITINDTVGSVEGSVAWLRDWSSNAFLNNLLSMLANITGEKKNCSENIFSFITEVIARIV